jgi:hypothetical protein
MDLDDSDYEHDYLSSIPITIIKNSNHGDEMGGKMMIMKNEDKLSQKIRATLDSNGNATLIEHYTHKSGDRLDKSSGTQTRNINTNKSIKEKKKQIAELIDKYDLSNPSSDSDYSTYSHLSTLLFSLAGLTRGAEKNASKHKDRFYKIYDSINKLLDVTYNHDTGKFSDINQYMKTAEDVFAEVKEHIVELGKEPKHVIKNTLNTRKESYDARKNMRMSGRDSGSSSREPYNTSKTAGMLSTLKRVSRNYSPRRSTSEYERGYEIDSPHSVTRRINHFDIDDSTDSERESFNANESDSDSDSDDYDDEENIFLEDDDILNDNSSDAESVKNYKTTKHSNRDIEHSFDNDDDIIIDDIFNDNSSISSEGDELRDGNSYEDEYRVSTRRTTRKEHFDYNDNQIEFNDADLGDLFG